jgi:hypothetical protein
MPDMATTPSSAASRSPSSKYLATVSASLPPEVKPPARPYCRTDRRPTVLILTPAIRAV